MYYTVIALNLVWAFAKARCPNNVPVGLSEQASCDMFTRCYRPQHEPHYVMEHNTCPCGLLFDSAKKSCEPAQSVMCSYDPCRRGASYWKAAQHCGAYWVCVNGQSNHVECCPTGYYFNKDMVRCEYDFYGSCSSACPCSRRLMCEGGKSLGYHRADRCDKSRLCMIKSSDPSRAKMVTQTCPCNTLWNVNTHSCTTARYTMCHNDPCRYLGRRSWAFSSHCRAYWLCENRRTARSLCCEYGHVYDPNSQSCRVDHARTCTGSCPCSVDSPRKCNRRRVSGDTFRHFVDEVVNGVQLTRTDVCPTGSYFCGHFCQCIEMGEYCPNCPDCFVELQNGVDECDCHPPNTTTTTTTTTITTPTTTTPTTTTTTIVALDSDADSPWDDDSPVDSASDARTGTGAGGDSPSDSASDARTGTGAGGDSRGDSASDARTGTGTGGDSLSDDSFSDGVGAGTGTGTRIIIGDSDSSSIIVVSNRTGSVTRNGGSDSSEVVSGATGTGTVRVVDGSDSSDSAGGSAGTSVNRTISGNRTSDTGCSLCEDDTTEPVVVNLESDSSESSDISGSSNSSDSSVARTGVANVIRLWDDDSDHAGVGTLFQSSERVAGTNGQAGTLYDVDSYYYSSDEDARGTHQQQHGLWMNHVFYDSDS